MQQLGLKPAERLAIVGTEVDKVVVLGKKLEVGDKVVVGKEKPGKEKLDADKVVGEAKLEGKLVYLRLDKQAKRTGLWSVGVCNKSREQSGGEKPRATTVLKMTHDEIRAAVCAADEPAV